MAKSEFQQFKDSTKEAHKAAKEFMKTGRMPEGQFNNARSTMSSQGEETMDGPIPAQIDKPIAYHADNDATPQPAPPRSSANRAPAVPTTKPTESSDNPPSGEEPGSSGPKLIRAKIGDTEVEVSEEKYNELKEDGLLEPHKPAVSDEERQLIEAARFMDTQFRAIPGLKDFVLKSIRSGRVPTAEDFQEKSDAGETPEDVDLDDPTKRAINQVLSRMEAKFEPLLKNLAERDQREQAQREQETKKEFLERLNSEIDSEMKAYPVFSRTNYAKIARERVIDRLRDNPKSDIRVLVAQTAALFTDEKKAELKEKVERASSNKEFVTPSGEGHSPTMGPKKEFTWDDFRKGKLKPEVSRILNEARRGSI